MHIHIYIDISLHTHIHKHIYAYIYMIALRFAVTYKPMWPARVRTPPCRSVVMERGGRVASGRRGEGRGGWERELPTTGHHGCVRVVNGYRPPSCLEKGGPTADGTRCRLACCFTRWVLYQSLDCTGTHLARLPRLLDFHKPSPGQWL